MKEPGDLQQRKMARSGRADAAAVLTVRAVMSTNSVHPPSVVKQTKASAQNAVRSRRRERRKANCHRENMHTHTHKTPTNPQTKKVGLKTSFAFAKISLP